METVVVVNKILIRLTVLLGMGLGSVTEAGSSELPLIPWPRELQVSERLLELTDRSRIVYGEDQLHPLADVLHQELYQVTGLRVMPDAGPGAKGDIVLKVDPTLPEETYIFKVTDRVEISGSNCKSTAMATVTLLQAVRAAGDRVTIPGMTITDQPHSAFRALLVDVARQPHTIDTFKQCVVLCRLYKINFMQLHLNDDQSFAFECLAYPKLATPGHHFTRAQLTELVAFADARGVTLVPELDAPGHTTAMRRAMPDLFGAPGLSVINIGREDALEAMETIIEELCGIFTSSPYVHIGADEAYFAILAQDDLAKKAIQDKGYRDVHDLFYAYIVRMHEKVTLLGRQTVMWESFGGTGSGRVEIPRDILVMAWETAYQLPQSLLDNGYNIINVSWKPNYLTPGWRWDPEYIYGWNMFRWENHWKAAPSYVPIQLESYPNDRIMGSMMCSWESSDDMEIPGIRLRLAPLSERIWSPNLDLPYDHFARRFAHTDQVLQKLIRPVAVEAVGLTDPDYIGPFYNRENHFGRDITVTLKPLIRDAVIRYTLDGSVPTQASQLCRSPITLKETTTLRIQVYDASGDTLGGIATIPYEHHPITGRVDGLLMQVRHDNGRGRYRTQFGKEVTVTLQCAMPGGTLRYTTDGRQPTDQSTRYTGPVALRQSGALTARYFDDQGRPQGEPWRRDFEQLDAEDNLTTGKPVTASGVTTASMPPENAVDGIVDRDVHWDSSAGAPQWWQVDLEAPHTLNRVRIFTYWDDARYYQYRVDVSLDGETWHQVVDFSQNRQKATSKGFVHDFDPIMARYIRVTMLYNSANPGLHLVEVRAFAQGE
jgi:hexosaminidase